MAKKPELPIDLPPAFDPQLETNKVLKKAKTSASKKFSWTRNEGLFEAARLAYLLVVFDKEDEALEICRFLGQMEFKGHQYWTAVQFALTLQARLARQRGEKKEAEVCLDRIRKIALDEKDEKRELPARISRACEIAFIIELGGSKKCPVKQMEKEWNENLARLKMLAGA